jgi:3-oxoadipate enol-lactonase
MTAALDLSWEIAGKRGAPAIILGHSLGTDRSMWNGQREAFEASYRVLTLDLRGHGASPVPSAPYALEEIALDVLRAADGAGLSRFVYCGVSLGGIVGLFLAARHPERIGALVAANTAAKIGTEAGWHDRISLVRANGLAGMTETAIERWLAPSFRASEPSAVERLRLAFRQTSPEGYAGCCAALATADLRRELAGIRVPSLVIAGELDVATPVADAEFVHAGIPGSRLVVLAGAAHLSNVDQRAGFNAAVHDFLKDVPAD